MGAPCNCGQSVPLTHGDHHTRTCPMYAEHDGIDEFVAVETATAEAIARWLENGGVARTGSDVSARATAKGIRNGEWRLFEGTPPQGDKRCSRWNCEPSNMRRCRLPAGHSGDCDC